MLGDSSSEYTPKHREKRSGGKKVRTASEIFIDAAQGKFAEFGFYNYFIEKGWEMDEPDVKVCPRSIWDSVDFVVDKKNIAVKSVKHYSNLLLLEQDDWNSEGKYIPNLDRNDGTDSSDFIYLLRVESNLAEKVSTASTIDEIQKLIFEGLKDIHVKVNIPGFITKEDLVDEIIKKII